MAAAVTAGSRSARRRWSGGPVGGGGRGCGRKVRRVPGGCTREGRRTAGELRPQRKPQPVRAEAQWVPVDGSDGRYGVKLGALLLRLLTVVHRCCLPEASEEKTAPVAEVAEVTEKIRDVLGEEVAVSFIV